MSNSSCRLSYWRNLGYVPEACPNIFVQRLFSSHQEMSGKSTWTPESLSHCIPGSMSLTARKHEGRNGNARIAFSHFFVQLLFTICSSYRYVFLSPINTKGFFVAGLDHGSMNLRTHMLGVLISGKMGKGFFIWRSVPGASSMVQITFQPLGSLKSIGKTLFLDMFFYIFGALDPPVFKHG